MSYFGGYLWACWAALSISFTGDLCRESLHSSSLRRRQDCLGCEVPGKYSSICKLRVPPGKHYKWEYVCACVLSCNQFFAVLLPIESVIPFNNLIFCSPLLLLPSIFPRIRVFSNESALCIKWPKYWSFSFSISPSKEYSGLISFRTDGLISLQSKGLSRVSSNTTVKKHQFFGAQLSLWSNSHIHT